MVRDIMHTVELLPRCIIQLVEYSAALLFISPQNEQWYIEIQCRRQSIIKGGTTATTCKECDGIR